MKKIDGETKQSTAIPVCELRQMKGLSQDVHFTLMQTRVLLEIVDSDRLMDESDSDTLSLYLHALASLNKSTSDYLFKIGDLFERWETEHQIDLDSKVKRRQRIAVVYSDE